MRQPTLPPVETLLPLVNELAELALNQRIAFFGLLRPCLLSNPEPLVRAAAVRALTGACGPPAWRHLVVALKDPELPVRLAAVEALRVSAQTDAARWVHALYHADPHVREKARELAAPPRFRELFPDPALFTGEEKPANVPDHHAYGWPPPADLQKQVRDAIANPSSESTQVLQDFLQRGTDDDAEIRHQAACQLLNEGLEEEAFPVLAAAFSQDLRLVNPGLLLTLMRGVTTTGLVEFENNLINALCNRAWHDHDQPAIKELLTQACDLNTRYWARDYAWSSVEQASKLGRLARVFAWGVEMGKLLTGQRFDIEMVVNETDLGYTRLRENRLHITPLPLLRDERNGALVVRALILHEYGHHMYHKGPEADAVWEQANTEGLGRLLNLVTDEHLERNLRQRNRRYGDLLKVLNAYAFQYGRREIAVYSLLAYLGKHVDDVLPRIALGPAHKYGHVVVRSGQFLKEMEEAGHSFSRFMRALRMGLGNRTGDPRVAEALALFKGQFRKSTMPELHEIARRLREIFGAETNMLEDFGLERALAGNEMDWLAHGAGINQQSLSQAVNGLLNPDPRPGDDKSPGNMGPGWGLNLRPEETFKPLTQIVKLPHNPAQHADYARRVARAARQLRRYFQDLGLGLKTDRGRLRGHHLDRTRIRALVLRRDPRLLQARKVDRFTDLFMGVAIDCSGSMAGEKLEKARLFGTLLAEALQGQRGVDLRLFGFTDRVLFDAGDARRCAASSLNYADGNNDAGALWHIYRLARASKRRAKLLVMISDGLPTDCSVAALKALVLRLTRWGYCAAQVAVQPLEQICFPHYVLLQDKDFDAAVRKFGEVVMRLVSQALGK